MLMLSGCFDYRGLEDQAVIAGIAIDSEDEGYRLTFEIVDIIGAENGQFGAMILTSTGKSFSDALADAREKLHREMYLGTLRVVLLSREIAEDAGIKPFVTHLLHDLHVRNSLPLVIAGEETAGALLTSPEREEQRVIISNLLGERLGGQNNTAPAPTLHESYNALLTQDGEITLPIVEISEIEGIFFELTGLAQFRDGRLEKER